jgi:hypothetical protein
VTEDQALNVLSEMKRQYPKLDIWVGQNGPEAFCWFAKGRGDQSPWLIMSSDLDRFWRWLAA